MAMDVIFVLLGVALVLFFGFFAEFVFRKTGIPDVLFLIILGFVIGPNVLNYISSTQFIEVAPLFTTFTLLFLLFDGAFNIHLSSLIREFSNSFLLTLFNFVISTIVVGVVMMFSGYSILISLLTGFILGGVSSSFVIPILKQLNISEHIYSLLTLESALTDVFCIVFSLTVLEILNLGGFGFQETFSQLAALFAIAGFIGAIAGVIWIFLTVKVFKEPHYMVTIAYLLMVYVVTEFLRGNGAIATLFLGLVLKNSKQLTFIFKGIKNPAYKKLKNKISKDQQVISVVKPQEQFFYDQISFLLKTFFFVYIGLLIDISDTRVLIIGGIISFILLFSRTASLLFTKRIETDDPSLSLINSMFARGLAAAAITQVVLQAGLPQANFIASVTYVVITGTIILSSVRIFFVRRSLPKREVKA